MKSINIKLSLAENVKTFVSMVNRYPYDMDLRAGRLCGGCQVHSGVSSVWI